MISTGMSCRYLHLFFNRLEIKRTGKGGGADMVKRSNEEKEKPGNEALKKSKIRKKRSMW